MRWTMALGLLAAFAVAPPAAAQGLAFGPCGLPGGVECARVDVPLDRSGAVPGTVSLRVERVRASSGTASDGVLVAIAGGPGDQSTLATLRFQSSLAGALRTRDLVVFDQRGTGASGAIHCA